MFLSVPHLFYLEHGIHKHLSVVNNNTTTTMHKPSFKRENYITDTVGHTGTRINIEDFNRKFREWELRRGFRTEDTVTPIRGMALRSAKRKVSK